MSKSIEERTISFLMVAVRAFKAGHINGVDLEEHISLVYKSIRRNFLILGICIGELISEIIRYFFG